MTAGALRMAIESSTREIASPMLTQRSVPRAGDVLVSARTARADVYEISVVPAHPHLVAPRYQEAIEAVRELARQLGVDGWYTADQTHYARVATHRTSTSPSHSDD